MDDKKNITTRIGDKNGFKKKTITTGIRVYSDLMSIID